MIMKSFKSALLLLTIFLASCVQTDEIENIGIINAQGMDLTASENIKSTFVVFQFTAQSEAITKTIQGEGITVEGAMEDAAHTSMYPLVPGKLKLTLFGEEMAKKGVFSLLDTQARDTRVPDSMYLAVGKPNAEEILSTNGEELSVDPGQYLYDLIHNHTNDHNIPRKTLQDFLRIYYDVGMDNILPIFKIEDDMPKHVGGALFHGDKMVGEITNDEIVYINLIQRTVRDKLHEIELPIEPFESYLEPRQKGKSDTIKVAFMIDKGTSKVNLTDVNALQFDSTTTLNLSLLEQSAGLVLDEVQAIQVLEKEIKKKLEKELDMVLEKLQTHKCDPFGFGLMYKETKEGKKITEKEWHELFPTIKVSFNIDVTLIRHGVTD